MAKKVQNITYNSARPGYKIIPVPITDGPRMESDDIKGITYRKIGGTWHQCYMIEVPTRIANYITSYDRELSDEARKASRHIISSPKTGKRIVCDFHNSCYGCPYAGCLNMETNTTASIEQMYEDTGAELPMHDATSDIAISEATLNELLTELRHTDQRLADILNLRLQGLEAKEIGIELGIKKSTLYDNMKRIRDIAAKYL